VRLAGYDHVAITDKRQAGARAAKEAVEFPPTNFMTGVLLDLPFMIELNIDQLFLLGELAGPSCLQLVGMLSQYSRFVFESRIAAMTADQ